MSTFEHILQRHRGLIFSVCQRYSRQGATADDLVQEVTLTLWQRREQLMAITIAPRQTAWIWRVARSTCIDILRRTPPTYPLPEAYDPPDNLDSSHSHHLHQLIQLLEEPDRTIIRRHIEGYNYEEIAQQTGLTANNISVRLVRIKERLRQMWEK
ncbi:MAG: sigma-70 family RNA polymerase sigma factor [Bacteroidales bacterium]|nr:sigma-70 family RNA polymerase sigma factor [Bacteroidales bacterium]